MACLARITVTNVANCTFVAYIWHMIGIVRLGFSPFAVSAILLSRGTWHNTLLEAYDFIFVHLFCNLISKSTSFDYS